MEKLLDSIEEKRNELTKKHNAEIEYIKNGLKMLEIDELPEAVRQGILNEINYSFVEKWKCHKKAMATLDEQMPDKYY